MNINKKRFRYGSVIVISSLILEALNLVQISPNILPYWPYLLESYCIVIMKEEDKIETYKRGVFCRVTPPYSCVLVSTYFGTDPHVTNMIQSWYNFSFSHVTSTLICLIYVVSLSLMIYYSVAVFSPKIGVVEPWMLFIECSKNLQHIVFLVA